MRIVIVCNYYAPAMGYAENLLPRALKRLGHDVQVITSTLKPYGLSPFYEDTYQGFLGPRVVEPGSFQDKGIVAQRLPYWRIRDRVGLRGLSKALAVARPDVVEVLDHASLTALQAARVSKRLGFQLFTASHLPVSVFQPAQASRLSIGTRLKLWSLTSLPARYVSSRANLIYAPTDDAGEVAVRFFGVPRSKLRHMSLGVDTDAFHPVNDEKDRDERSALRAQLDVGQDELLCIYTGRFTVAKDPALLARAVSRLREKGHGFRALFIGNGEQSPEISRLDGTLQLPLVDYADLPPYYRAADIGVWPMQETTSLFDAAASGLPLIVSDQLHISHTISGNGLTYRKGSLDDLERVLLELENKDRREVLGAAGSRKMVELFSWDVIAARRVEDYKRSLGFASR